MALNKTKSENFSCSFTRNLIAGSEGRKEGNGLNFSSLCSEFSLVTVFHHSYASWFFCLLDPCVARRSYKITSVCLLILFEIFGWLVFSDTLHEREFWWELKTDRAQLSYEILILGRKDQKWPKNGILPVFEKFY